jgi:hypothetical protein
MSSNTYPVPGNKTYSTTSRASQAHIIGADSINASSITTPNLHIETDEISFFGSPPALQQTLGGITEINIDVPGAAITQPYTILKNSLIYVSPKGKATRGLIQQDTNLVATVDAVLPIYNIEGGAFRPGVAYHVVVSPTVEFTTTAAVGGIKANGAAWDNVREALRAYGLIAAP